MKAVLRRTRRGERPADGGVKLDEAGHRATIGGADLNLTAVEFQLLKLQVRVVASLPLRTNSVAEQ